MTSRSAGTAQISLWTAPLTLSAPRRSGGVRGGPARAATIDGLVYASSMVVLYAARHRVPVPSLARWLLALGIAATLTANLAQGWSHGPIGAVIAAWPAVSLWARTNSWSGSSAPAGRQHAGRRSAPLHWRGLPCCAASCPGLSH